MSPEDNETPKNYIHYQLERTDYSATEDELQRLGQAGHNLWKDFCLACIFPGLALLINAINETSNPEFKLTLGIFLNYLFGGLLTLIGLGCFIGWIKTKTDYRDIIKAIKEKPRLPVKIAKSGGTSQLVIESPPKINQSGGQEQITVAEATETRITGGESILEIIKAEYWTPKARFDITEELKRKIADNKLEIIASNDIKGDPDPGTVKKLSIEYKFNGITLIKEFTEGDNVVIP